MRGNLFCKKRFPRTPSKKLSNKRSKRKVFTILADSRRKSHDLLLLPLTVRHHRDPAR